MTKQTLLTILQQAEYEWPRLLEWEHRHRSETSLTLHPRIWTLKLKLINALSSLFIGLPVLTQIHLALLVLMPFDWLARSLLVGRALLKLRWLQRRGLIVVAIAGSYAKTSTKHILYHTLKQQRICHLTANSVNTPLGIADEIWRHLNGRTQIFIVELGEYYPGDIKRLCQFIRPAWGILTPIGHQHLDRMHSMETVAQTVGELVGYFKARPTHVLSAASNQDYLSLKGPTYGTQKTASYRVSSCHVTRAGTEFQVHTPKAEYRAFTPLYGEHQAVNSLSSFWLAHQLNLEPVAIVKQLATIPFIPRRHEPTFAQANVLILDNSYNTNPDSVKESLKLLQQLEPTKRLVVTLGFSELGSESATANHTLGEQLAKNADAVGIINSPWAPDIQAGWEEAGGDPKRCVIAPTMDAALAAVQAWVESGSVILLEGGYQEIYA